jgi:hypothetical protein
VSFGALLNQTATVYSIIMTSDDLGGSRPTRTTVTSNLKCRVRALSSPGKPAGQRADSAGNITVLSHRMYCPPTTLAEGNEVEVGAVTYDVMFVNRIPGGLINHHYEVDLRERRPDVRDDGA